MRFSSFSITLALLGSVSALVTPKFAPRTSPGKASRSPLFRKPSFLLSTPDADDVEVTSEDKADAVLGEILVISDDDMAAAKLEIQKNWGFILTTGVADILAGCAAIAAPIYATAIAQVTQLAALFVIGFSNIVGTFYVEKGLKARSLLLGVAQIATGIVLGNNPVEFRYLATLFIASLGFADGLYRLVLAVQNADLAERGWTIFTGLVSMAVSSLVAANLDVTSLFALGMVMGSLFIGAGWGRIFVAFCGRADANAVLDPTSAAT
eukprot:CAMPEP_0202494318 /NCGR_PEP_ID=MMETSP1361-20130828/11098_1 /ASSEMBLY_ACC=CAM_ASM_000849 /TAXON_ID=210615 /ORGANISM="Staurosira complex sp., Strain CCMP2646" /LENGTH=265 /DNA_ID=CAMNT_0049124753 /DNA_START=23 /DNA_END=820 /DNA_ORIENTATION=+